MGWVWGKVWVRGQGACGWSRCGVGVWMLGRDQGVG